MRKKFNMVFMLLLVFLVIVIAIPSNANAATEKFIVKGNIEYTITEGERLYLYVKTTKNIKWSSSNKKVATVSKKGVVIGKQEGKTTITATIGKTNYKCKVIVYNYEEDLKYLRDIAERDYINEFSTLSPDTKTEIIKEANKIKEEETKAKTKEQIKLMLKYGFSTSDNLYSELGKAYMKFCDEWVSVYELKNTYRTSIVQDVFYDRIYFINYETDFRYIIENVPSKLNDGQVYTTDGIQYQYLKEFKIGKESLDTEQLFFSRNDLEKQNILTPTN